MKTVPKKLEVENDIVGGLSSPSKMPCFSFSTPARLCKVGGKLRKLVGSVCSKCYAMKGFYAYANVKSCLQNRYDNLYHPDWVQSMVKLIGGVEGSGHFRWFDSGDLDSLKNLKNIVKVAIALPHIKFWLPTKEYKIVSEFLKEDKFPDNLNVRLSGYMIDGTIPTAFARKHKLTMSTVVSSNNFNCPAKNQNNYCLNCRNCWNKEVEVVSYPKH